MNHHGFFQLEFSRIRLQTVPAFLAFKMGKFWILEKKQAPSTNTPFVFQKQRTLKLGGLPKDQTYQSSKTACFFVLQLFFCNTPNMSKKKAQTEGELSISNFAAENVFQFSKKKCVACRRARWGIMKRITTAGCTQTWLSPRDECWLARRDSDPLTHLEAIQEKYRPIGILRNCTSKSQGVLCVISVASLTFF